MRAPASARRLDSSESIGFPWIFYGFSMDLPQKEHIIYRSYLSTRVVDPSIPHLQGGESLKKTSKVVGDVSPKSKHGENMVLENTALQDWWKDTAGIMVNRRANCPAALELHMHFKPGTFKQVILLCIWN